MDDDTPAPSLSPEPPEQPRVLEPPQARVLPAWDQVASDFRTAFPTLDESALRQRYEHNRRLSEERARYANAQETTLGYIGRRAIPFGSAAAQAHRTASYGEAMQRFRGGQPAPDDYGLIAAYERQQHLDQEEGIGGSLTRIPAQVGEAYFGGRMLGAAGAFGRAAAPATGAAQMIGRGAQFTGQAALTTAHMPSMWLPEWTEDNVSHGRRPYDLAGLPRALGLGTLQTMVFGSLGKIANDVPGAEVGDYIKRLAMRTGVGVVEQQGIDLISGALTANSDRPTGFGLLGDLVAGRGGDALKRLSHQAVLFGAFAAMHEAQHAPITRQFADALQSYARAGRSRGEAAAELAPVTAMHEEQLQAGRNKEELRTLYEAMPEGPARDYALALANGAPAAPIPEQPPLERPGPDMPNFPPEPAQAPRPAIPGGSELPPPGQFRQPEGPQPSRRVSAPITPEQAQAALVQEQARMQAEGRNAARRPEQEAPTAPPERFAAVPDADLKAVAKQLGLAATGKRADLIERIVRQGGEHFLTALEGGEAKPAGPKVIPPEPAVAIAPHVERAFLDAFPDGTLTRRGELEAQVGGRTVYVSHDAGRNMARIDFEAERPGVPAEMQAGSLSLARSLRTLAGKLAATGVGVEYRAIDTNRGGPERRQGTQQTGFRRRRSDIYADALAAAGYEQVGGPGVDKGELYAWRPRQEAPAGETPTPPKPPEAPPVASEPPVAPEATQTAPTQPAATPESVVERVIQQHPDLSAREKDILLRRQGVAGRPAESLRDIGKSMGLSYERIRQIEEAALQKMGTKHLEALEALRAGQAQAEEGETILGPGEERGMPRGQRRGAPGAGERAREETRTGAAPPREAPPPPKTTKEFAGRVGDAFEQHGDNPSAPEPREALINLIGYARGRGLDPYRILKKHLGELHDSVGEETMRGLVEEAEGIYRDFETLTRAARAGGVEPPPLRRIITEHLQATEPVQQTAPPRSGGPEVQTPSPSAGTGDAPGGPPPDRPADAPAAAGGGAAGGHELSPVVVPLAADILRGGDLHSWRQLETILRREYGVDLPDVRAMQKAAKEAAGPGLPEMTVKMKSGRGHHAQMAARLTQEQLIEHINRAMLGREAVDEALQAGQEAHVAPAQVQGDLAALAGEIISREIPEGGETPATPTTPPGVPVSDVPYTADLFGPRPGAAAAGPAGTTARPAGGAGAFDLTRTVESWMPVYREGGRPRYRTREQAAEIGTMEAGDVPAAVHELAHHIATQERMPLEPSKLPPDVAAGLRQFDYEPSRANQREAMQEGFAEWVRRRTMGQMQGLSPEQQSAARYLETLMTLAAPEGEPRTRWAQRLDQLRTLYAQMAGGTPAQQAGGLLSATGKPPAPVLTPAEQARTLWDRVKNWWQDNVTNNLAVLQRAGMDRAHTLWGRLQFGEQNLARRFGEEGVGTLRDGKWTVIGPSKAKIVETLVPADLEPLKPKDASWWGRLSAQYDNPQQVSRASLWATATHVLSEHEAGRTVVPEAQLELFRQARAEMAQDEAFVRRATEFHRRLTAAYNAGLDALAAPEVHRLSPETVELLKARRPDYVPTTRVKEDADWKANVGPRSKGRENMAAVLHERTGSGEQIVDPLVGYEQRLHLTATQLAEQLRRNAVAEYLQQPEMGEWALQNKEPVIGMDGQTAYWKPEPWSKDPSKNTWYWYGPDGELQNWRVKDRALYDLLTHQQGNDSAVAQFFRAMSNIAPLRWSAEAVRKGATYLSLGFQARNVSPWRDPYEFLKNTIDQASVTRLPEFYRRVYAAEAAILRGNIPADEVFNLFARERGREQRQFAFETPGVETARSKAEIVKQVLNVAGAGELAPRMLEFVNRLKAQGWTEARLEAEIKRARDVQRQGGEYQDPVPWSVLQDAMQAANEVTVPFSRLGTITREVNKLVPFFGPAVSGISKAVRNWKENTKGAAVALGAYLTARLAYWAAYKDEDWYKELSSHDRFNNFVVPIPGLGLRRLPGARDFEVPVGGALTSSLEALSGQRPDVAGLIAQSYQAVMPNQGQPPLPPLANVAWQLGTNRNWMGQPIVPRRDENLPAGHNLMQHQAPYAAEQLLGGGGGLIRRGVAGLMPFSEVRNAHRSVDEVYDRLHGLEAQRTLVRRQGLAFPQEREYQVLHRAAQQITRLGQTAAGHVHVGTRVVEREAPAEERVRELRTRQVELARRALEAAR